ncbi:MAG: hypothetical protein AAF449_11070 [Myxococcota bacterium]
MVEAQTRFEAQVQPAFVRHDLHISHILSVQADLSPVGEIALEAPNEFQLISISSQNRLTALFVDREFLDALPQRAAATERLIFFLSQLITAR